MVFRLPPIRDLQLSAQDDHYPLATPPRDERLAKVLTRCQTLCSFAEHYASTSPNPDPSEVDQMVDHAVEVIELLKDYKRTSYPSTPTSPPPQAVARPPKRIWEDAVTEQDVRRVTASPPAERSSPASSASPAPRAVPPAQEAQMHVFDGVPERQAPMDDEAKAVAARDMEDIRARRVASNGIAQGKVKYKKRSRASPPGHCRSCGIEDTPEWRRGPDGQRTLCNACGLHYAKLVRKRDRIISTIPEGGPLPPPIDIAFLRKSAQLAAENSAIARSAGRRRTVDDSKSRGPKSEGSPSNKRTASQADSEDGSSSGAGRDSGCGRRGWGRRDEEDELMLAPSFPRAHPASYPPPPAGPHMSPGHHASSGHPSAVNIPPPNMSFPPPSGAMHHTTLPSMRPYAPAMSYPPAPPGSYPPGYGQPPAYGPSMHQPSHGPPHGYPQAPMMGTPMQQGPSQHEAEWNRYLAGVNRHPPRS